MADAIAGSVAILEGNEIVNDARTITYLKAGYGPPSLNVRGDCGCDPEQVRELIGCDDEPYSTPTNDLAPWYDPAFPESADFAGFYVESFEGMESTYTREVFNTITGGGVLGRLRPDPRTMTWKGFLFGRTCCATAYGLRWLTSILRQAKCGSECGGESLEILVCCPPVSGTDVCTGLPPEGSPAPGDAFRTLYNVGLLEGPLIRSERKSGCGTCGGCSAIMEIEFSLVAGNPHLYRSPILLADCEPFPPGEQFLKVDGVCPTPSVSEDLFIKVASPEECPDPDTCAVATPCISNDPNCPTPSLPVVTTVVDPCICDPYFPVTTLVEVPADTFGMNFEGAPIFSVYAGSVPLRSTTIKIMENPLGRPCEEIAADPCFFCDSITIRWLPAFSTLVIDSVNKRITIECPGGAIYPGEPYLVGNFSFPVFECINYCISATIDSATAGSDACFSMSITPKEM